MRNEGNTFKERLVKLVRAVVIIVLTVVVTGPVWLIFWLELSLGSP